MNRRVEYRTDWTCVIVWTFIAVYIAAVLIVAGYFVHKAFASTPRCEESGIITLPDGMIGQMSAISCEG